MSNIKLHGISHWYDTHLGEEENGGFAIRDLNISWKDDSANALLGPSGCGKTTLLNMISGLLKPREGQVLFDGRDVTSLSPKDRHVAQVFQFPVVYDTMDVFDNLAFPLRNEGMSEKDIKARVEEIADILELSEALKLPSEKLTAADKQKVSLGRGIVRSTTAVVLLDEPLTVIDPKLKWILRRKLRQVQRQLGVTMIYVTHDQHEALTFADHVTVMKGGQIIQTGTPEELYTEPESPFIGFFIGSPGMNILACTPTQEGLSWEGFTLPISRHFRSKLNGRKGDLQLGIRPEFVRVSKERQEGGFPFSISIIEDTGAYKVLTLTHHGTKIKSRVPETVSFAEDEKVWVHFPEDKIKIFIDDKAVK